MGSVAYDVDGAAGPAQPRPLELVAVIGTPDRRVGGCRWVVDHDVPAGVEAGDHDEVARSGADRGTAELAPGERDRRDERDPGGDEPLGLAQVGQSGHERLAGQV